MLWIARFMVQRGLELFIDDVVRYRKHQFVLRPFTDGEYKPVKNEISTGFTDFGATLDKAVAEINYDENVTLDELLSTFEDAWIVNERISDYPEFVIRILNDFHLRLNDEQVIAILNEFSVKYLPNSSGITNIDITVEPEQCAKFFAISQELFKDSIQALFLTELNAYTSPFDYSLIDLTQMIEIPCALGEHGPTLAKLIKTSYQTEYERIVKLNDVEQENHWILTHFKFNGKYGGNNRPYRNESERTLYNNLALRKAKSTPSQ